MQGVRNISKSWQTAGTMEQSNPFIQYVEAAERFEDHPAIWGVSTGDEPSALDIPYYGKVIDFVEEHYPNQFAYLNLYPDYALNPKGTEEETRKGLRTSTYEECIEAYCRHVDTDYFIKVPLILSEHMQKCLL